MSNNNTNQADCENGHDFFFVTIRVHAREVYWTSVRSKTVTRIFKCRRCLEERSEHVASGTDVRIPRNQPIEYTGDWA